MRSTSLQSTFLHEGSQLEEIIIILQYSEKVYFYHKTGINLQYSQQSHLYHWTWYIHSCSVKLGWIFPFYCYHSHRKGSQGFVMFVLSLIRLNKTVCSLDGTETHICIMYTDNKHFGYSISIPSYTTENFYKWGQSENIQSLQYGFWAYLTKEK